MGLIILIQTIFISLIRGLINYNFWYSYILFLILIGGLIILFIYITRIASNEKFKLSYKLSLICIIIIILRIILLYSDNFIFNINLYTYDLNRQNLLIKNYLSLRKYFNWPNNIIIYLIIIYLFVTLIATVKITEIKSGPLRQKN